MRNFFLSCVFLLALVPVAYGKPLTADQIRTAQPLLPYFTWLEDPEGQETIESVTSGELEKHFAPLTDGIPLKGKGPVWLRLVLIKTPPTSTGAMPRVEQPRLEMNFGALPPGNTLIYLSKGAGPVAAEGTWGSEQLFPYGGFLLPEPGLLPVNIYIRMDEMPGLWFAPTVSPQNAIIPPFLPPDLLLPGLLIAAMIGCCLRAISDRAQWALWATLFLGCVLAQSMLPLPRLALGFDFKDLPVLLAPGMALMVLPHIGRCMLRSNSPSALQEGILYLCSLVGVVVCLAPLMPGMSWLTRLFPLWPLLLVPLLPICLGSLAGRRPGALAFSGACVMPILGAAVTLFALESPAIHPLAPQGSLWGLAVGGIGLVLARIPKMLPAAQCDSEKNAGLCLAESAADAAKAQAAAGGLSLAGTPSFTSHSQYDDLPPLQVRPLNAGESLDGGLAMAGGTRKVSGASELSDLPDLVDGVGNFAGLLSPSPSAGSGTDLPPSLPILPSKGKTSVPAGEANDVFTHLAETADTNSFGLPANAPAPDVAPYATSEHDVPGYGAFSFGEGSLAHVSLADETGLPAGSGAPAHALTLEPGALGLSPDVSKLPPHVPTEGGLAEFFASAEQHMYPSPEQPETASAAAPLLPMALSEDRSAAQSADASADLFEGENLAGLSEPDAVEAPYQPEAVEAAEHVLPDSAESAPESGQEFPLAEAPADIPEAEAGLEAVPGLGASFATPVMEPEQADVQPVTTAMASFDENPFPGILPDFAGTSDNIAAPAMTDARVISLEDDNFSTGYSLDLMEDLQESSTRRTSLSAGGGFVFSLHSLVRDVHDVVSPLAKNKGLIFSWYIAPALPPLLEGDAPRLRGALSLLLQNAVQATQQGSVQLAVRKNPVAPEPGHLLFSISDSGSAQRTDAGFFHAWELAARTGGSFNVEYSPVGGTQIAFTTCFAVPSEESALEHFGPQGENGIWDEAPGGSQAADRYAETDVEEDLMPVLHAIQASASSVSPMAALSLEMQEDPYNAALTPEQVLEEQGFLAHPDTMPPHASAGQDGAVQNTSVQEEPEHPVSVESAAGAAPDDSQAKAPAVVGKDTTIAEKTVAALSKAEGKSASHVSANTADSGIVRIIVAEMTTSNRRLLAHYLGELPHEHLEAGSSAQVLALFRETPVGLVVFDADMPEPDIIKTIAALRKDEKSRSLAPTPILVLTSHDAQSQRMLAAGSSHVLCKPFSQQGLQAVVARAIPAFAPAVALQGTQQVAESGTAVASAAAGAASGRPAVDPFVAHMRATGKTATAGSGKAGSEPGNPDHRSPSAQSAVEQRGPASALPAAPQADAADSGSASASSAQAVIHSTAAGSSAATAMVSPATGIPGQRPYVGGNDHMPMADRIVDAVMQQVANMDPLRSRSAVSAQDLAAHARALAATHASPLTLEQLEEQRAWGRTAPSGASDDVDLLAAALKDAPEQQGEPVEVQLPPTTSPISVTAETATGSVPEAAAESVAEPARLATDVPAAQPVIFSGTETAIAPDIRPDVQPGMQPGIGEADGEISPDNPLSALFLTGPAQPQVISLADVAADGTFAGQTAKAAPEPRSVLREGAAAPMILGLSAEDVMPHREPGPDAGIPLLDFIITGDETGESAPVESSAVSAPAQPVAGPVEPALQEPEVPVVPSVLPRTPRVPAVPTVAAVSVSVLPATTQETTPAAQSAGVPAPKVEPESEPAPEATSQGDAASVSIPAGVPADMSSTPSESALVKPVVTASVPVEATPAAPAPVEAPGVVSTPVETVVSPAPMSPPEEALPGRGQGAARTRPEEQTFALPGLTGEFIDIASLPLVPGLMHSLQGAMGDALRGLRAGQTILVQEATGRLAGKAEIFGLQKLGKISRCVERAAEADDLEAAATLLEDLTVVTNRYLESLQKCYQSFLNIDR